MMCLVIVIESEFEVAVEVGFEAELEAVIEVEEY
jgi:hypothetical protein